MGLNQEVFGLPESQKGKKNFPKILFVKSDNTRFYPLLPDTHILGR